MKFPKGFSFAGTACGIKTKGNDVGLIVADHACVAAGVYTQNIVRAACIDFNRRNSPTENCRAVVVNSGNANACTGHTGVENCLKTAQSVAQLLDCSADQVLVLSTGIIGQQLPMEKMIGGVESLIPKLGCDKTSFDNLTDAFLTTDRFRKTTSGTMKIGGGEFSLAGIAKGAGMIGPNMATMLAVFMTDFPLTQKQAQAAIERSVNQSFNRISVDGHTSTNDAVLLLSSGESNTEFSNDDFGKFQESLDAACIELAKMIPADGEGASHLVEIIVEGAASDADADRVARTIAGSNLVKTAVNGHDPNWGRIVSAAGYAGVALDPNEISLNINEITVFEHGSPMDFDEKVASESMAKTETTKIRVSIGSGAHSSIHWTSDLTTDYVVLNSEYHT